MIAVDAGSTDPGPYYLGSGASFTDRSAVRRDLALILTAARERGIPVLIGSAGGAGAAPHLAWAEGIVREIAAAHRLRFRLATIAADVETNLLLEALAGGDLLPLPAVPPATVEDITSCTFRVAQLGLPPLLRALELGADVILAGRCYDPAVFAAPAIRQGHDPALALHLGKILEARTACAYVRSALLHLGFPGRVATAGNLAFPFSPSDLDAGPVYRFALHHLLRGEAVATLGDVRIEEVA